MKFGGAMVGSVGEVTTAPWGSEPIVRESEQTTFHPYHHRGTNLLPLPHPRASDPTIRGFPPPNIFPSLFPCLAPLLSSFPPPAFTSSPSKMLRNPSSLFKPLAPQRLWRREQSRKISRVYKHGTSRGNRDTSALILSTKYTCSFSKSRGYFTRLQLRSRIITRRRCKAAFIKLLCRRSNVWRTPPARGMRLILAVYITETFHSATQLPSNTKYSPPPCWFGKMNSEGVAGGYSTYGLSEIIETLVNSREREVIERRELLRSADLEMNGWPEASGWREVWKRKGEETRVLFRFEFNYVSNVRIRNYRGI